MLSHLAHLQKLSLTRNIETSFRFERAQSAKWSQLARNRGDPAVIKNDLRLLNRECLAQCANDQQAEFNERKKSYEKKRPAKPSYPAYGKGSKRDRSRSRRRGWSDRYGKTSKPERSGSQLDRYKKDDESKNKTPPKKDEERKKAE